MPLQDFISMPWPQLVSSARQALLDQDVVLLEELDAVLRDRFLGVMKGREALDEFVTSVLKVLGSGEATRILERAGEVESLLSQWQVLAHLAEAEERVRQLERNAVERHVTGRPRR